MWRRSWQREGKTSPIQQWSNSLTEAQVMAGVGKEQGRELVTASFLPSSPLATELPADLVLSLSSSLFLTLRILKSQEESGFDEHIG